MGQLPLQPAAPQPRGKSHHEGKAGVFLFQGDPWAAAPAPSDTKLLESHGCFSAADAFPLSLPSLPRIRESRLQALRQHRCKALQKQKQRFLPDQRLPGARAGTKKNPQTVEDLRSNCKSWDSELRYGDTSYHE